jgi:tetratricopeptide (TPR) repeat protein
MGDLQLAVDDYSAVLSEEPERDGAWFGLAQAYYDLYRQTDEAIYLPDALEATRQAISASDGLDAETQAAYQRLLGDVAYDFEDFETATVAYRRYLDLTDVPSEQVTTRLETMP